MVSSQGAPLTYMRSNSQCAVRAGFLITVVCSAERWGITARAAWEIVFDASAAAEAKCGGEVVVRWMVPSNRTGDPAKVLGQARLAVEMVAEGRPVVSFGLHASEGQKADGSGPFPPEPFEQAFRVAAAGGLVSTPHAGEHLGHESCAAAVRVLGASRLLHGVRAAEDSATMELLARERICCGGYGVPHTQHTCTYAANDHRLW